MRTEDEYETAAMLLGMSYCPRTQSFWKRGMMGDEFHLDRDTLRTLPHLEVLERAGLYWHIEIERFAA